MKKHLKDLVNVMLNDGFTLDEIKEVVDTTYADYLLGQEKKLATDIKLLFTQRGIQISDSLLEDFVHRSCVLVSSMEDKSGEMVKCSENEKSPEFTIAERKFPNGYLKLVTNAGDADAKLQAWLDEKNF